MPVAPPTSDTRWRCAACGNLTRFDVVRTRKLREFLHADLAGEPVVEESETLSDVVEHVTCRWCGAVDQVELVPRPDGAEAAPPATTPASAVADAAGHAAAAVADAPGQAAAAVADAAGHAATHAAPPTGSTPAGPGTPVGSGTPAGPDDTPAQPAP